MLPSFHNFQAWEVKKYAEVNAVLIILYH
jgi:hypothetical protein